jgi:hypothetical protein
MASRARPCYVAPDALVNAASCRCAPLQIITSYTLRRHEAAELAFNECGKSDRGAILQELHSEPMQQIRIRCKLWTKTTLHLDELLGSHRMAGLPTLVIHD